MRKNQHRELKNKFKCIRVSFSETEAVNEMQIFEIALKEQMIPKNILKMLDRSIPYQIL
jgi:hypothetical protein